MFGSSSVVERSAVNRNVVGSNPTSRAIISPHPATQDKGLLMIRKWG